MGQSSSVQLETYSSYQASPIPVKKPPPPRPNSPPVRPANIPVPKSPTYAVPANRVLPGELPKRKLRPVSQEISKFIPEFAQLFPPKNESSVEKTSGEEDMDTSYLGDLKNESFDQKYHSNTETVPNHEVNFVETKEPGNFLQTKEPGNFLQTKDAVTANGHIPNTNHLILQSNNKQVTQGESVDVNLKRTNSLDRVPVKPKGHRRHPSMTTSLMNEQHTIFEDPREHLYDQWRKDPYSHSLPNVVSLPMRNNFDLDVSYNLTYAQLAEHRRKKHLEDIERKTGINLQKLSTDLADKSAVEPSPFERLPLRESTRSTSTASSECGVSKRKKKRAPPPPSQPSPAKGRNGTAGYSVDDEPPVDYEMESPPKAIPNHILQRKMSITSVSSANSMKTKMPPPPPTLPKSTPAFTLQNKNAFMENNETIPPKDVSMANKEKTPSKDESADNSEKLLKPKNGEQEAVSKLDALLQSACRSENTESFNNQSEDFLSEMSDKQSDSAVSETSQPAERKIPVNYSDEEDHTSDVSSEDKNTNLVKRLNSLVKPKSPVPYEKPKNPDELFREQLAKAYSDREDRRKMEQEKADVSEVLHKKQKETVQILRRLSKGLDKKWLKTSMDETDMEENLSAREAHDQEETDGKNTAPDKTENERVYSNDWTPEHDLGSDDDIEDRHTISHQRSTSEGFKSSIIPSKVKDLNTGKKTGKYNHRTSDSSADENKNKYGSIRKLKKSVHKSVKNAFGSISRASGKLLRKQKNHDLETEPEPRQSNWQLSSAKAENTNSLSHSVKRSSKYEVHTPVESDNDSNDGLDEQRDLDGEEDLDVVDVKLEENVKNENNDRQVKMAKRAGVAYVSGHKQIVLLPDFERIKVDEDGNVMEKPDNDDDDNRAPRLFRKKKKKFMFESTVRKQEREKMEELMAEQIREKERQIEVERRRQLEMEKEFHRLRALENQERLQRLQTFHMQQQLQTMQQQQQQHHHQKQFAESVISAPPLPPAGGIPNYITDYSHSQAFSPMIGHNLSSAGMEMPYGHVGGQSIGGNVPSLSSLDINYLGNLMKMNGVQPPTSPHQWAYLLSSVNFTSQPSDVRPTKSMYVNGTGPDLTQIFSGKTYDDSHMPAQKRNMFDIFAGKNSHGLNTCENHMTPVNPTQFGRLLEDFQDGTKTEKYTDSLPEQLSDKPKQRSNPLYDSSDDENEIINGLSPARTSKGLVASVHVKDYRDVPHCEQNMASVMNRNVPNFTSSHVNGSHDILQSDALIVNGHVNNTSGSPTGIYGPIGFKPVSFQYGSHVSSSAGDDDSSSGADR